MNVADVAVKQPTEMQYRQTVANFPSGVTVVTTHSNGEDIGLTVSAFASLSLDPPMVLVSIDRKSRSQRFLELGAPIGISVLAAQQADIAVSFARHGHDRFAGVHLQRHSNIPFISGAAAWFFGEVTQRCIGGDHVIMAVAVRDCGFAEGVAPLLYQNGRLHSWPGYGAALADQEHKSSNG